MISVGNSGCARSFPGLRMASTSAFFQIFGTVSWSAQQGRSDGGISVYIPPKSVYLKIIFSGCCSSVTQDRFDMIYVHVWDNNICFEIAMIS